MKGTVKIRGLSVDTTSIDDRLDTLQTILEETRRQNIELMEGGKKETVIREIFKERDASEDESLWQKVKKVMGKKIW